MTQEETNANLQGQIDELNRKIESLNQKPQTAGKRYKDIEFFENMRVNMLLTGRKWTNVTSSRAKDTVYANRDSALMVMATFRCAIGTVGGNAYVQGKSDMSTTPTTIASGIAGIETGLLNEDNTYQIIFIVAPNTNYQIVSAATNGTVTLGSWFEIAF